MSCAILAHERTALDNIFMIVKRAHDNMPAQLKPKTRLDNVNEYVFDKRFDGETLDSTIYVAMKIRSGTVQNLHITEKAYIKNISELNAGSKQAVPLTGRISEESTGNGMNEFYEDVMESFKKTKIGPMDYKAYFYPWFQNPEYTLPGEIPELTKVEVEIKEKFHLTDGQLLWRRWKMNELKTASIVAGLTGEQLFKQEYPATLSEAFQAGSGNVFDTGRLENAEPEKPKTEEELLAEINLMFPNINDEPMRNYYIEKVRELLKYEVSIWRLPIVGYEYKVGCDPSDGAGADSGSISAWGQTPSGEQKEQVAQFYGKMRPDELAEIIKLIAEFYNHAFVGIENNMLSTILIFIKIYDNYYSKVDIDEKTQKRTRKIGWNTNMKTRDVMIDNFIQLFDEDVLIIRSAITLGEMRTFVRKENGKREHADGKNDDALFGDFIALMMFKFDRPKARGFEQKAAGF